MNLLHIIIYRFIGAHFPPHSVKLRVKCVHKNEIVKLCDYKW